MTSRWVPAPEPDTRVRGDAATGLAIPAARRRGARYAASVPLRLLVMAVVAVFDLWVLAIGLVMSLAAAFADFLLSPRHWRERPSYLRLPRPWEIPPAAPVLLRGHWRRIVVGEPHRHRPTPSERWP